MLGKSLLSMADLTGSQIEDVLNMSVKLKKAHKDRQHIAKMPYPLSLAMVFEKPSLRTRVTFDLGMRQLGGLTTILGPAEIAMGERESVPDVAQNLERWTDAIMARVFKHETLVQLRDNCSVPVINGLSDLEHPCQILTDFLTIQEIFGKLDGIKLTWVGDGYNMLNSLMLGGALTGMTIAAACPIGYEPDIEFVKQARTLAGENDEIVNSPMSNTQSSIHVLSSPAEAAMDADVIYTDVWTSMGQEKEQIARIAAFRPFQVNTELMELAKPEAVFLHCLPAHRGDEVTPDVIDGPQSRVFDQAENRLHAQKGLLALILGL